MAETLSSVRIRTSLHHALRLTAARLSVVRDMQISMRSLLEEEIEVVLDRPLDEWVRWSIEGHALVNADETTSEPFRIRSDLSKKLNVLAASIMQRSLVPVTKIQLLEEAGREIIRKTEEELATYGVSVPGSDQAEDIA